MIFRYLLKTTSNLIQIKTKANRSVYAIAAPYRENFLAKEDR